MMQFKGYDMDRRAFLFKSLGWTLAGMAGFSPFSKALAMGRRTA